ncbi:hypothetical protein [Dietzia sp. SYD-A1]|uniref:hypothetical protein n=1 Tax=Dietzia sp. SYD-A1 TaxID=2780141 RepID=UPI0018919FD6|nr:hypothetical protein [Dietzia sp. SYD-A1]
MSFAALALGVCGAGVVSLGLTALAVALLPLPPAGRAVAAVAGVLLTVVAMGVVSARLTDRAIRAEYGDEPGDEPRDEAEFGGEAHLEEPSRASGPAEGDGEPPRADGLR